jgi:hypothetical protein
VSKRYAGQFVRDDRASHEACAQRHSSCVRYLSLPIRGESTLCVYPRQRQGASMRTGGHTMSRGRASGSRLVRAFEDVPGGTALEG